MPAPDDEKEVTETVTVSFNTDFVKKWFPILIAAAAGGGISNFGLDQLGFKDTACHERVDKLEKEFNEFKASELEHWRTINDIIDGMSE